MTSTPSNRFNHSLLQPVQSISPGMVDTEIVPDHVRAVVGETMLRSEDISQAVLFTLATPPNMQVHEMIIKPIGELF